MPRETENLEVALSTYDREKYRSEVEEAERSREQAWKQFPLAGWPDMPLERYALGQAEHRETFCRWMEFKTIHLGSMKGVSAGKHIIYKHVNKPGWWYPSVYHDEQETWVAVRAAFVEAFKKAGDGEWDEIDAIEPLRWGRCSRPRPD